MHVVRCFVSGHMCIYVYIYILHIHVCLGSRVCPNDLVQRQSWARFRSFCRRPWPWHERSSHSRGSHTFVLASNHDALEEETRKRLIVTRLPASHSFERHLQLFLLLLQLFLLVLLMLIMVINIAIATVASTVASRPVLATAGLTSAAVSASPAVSRGTSLCWASTAWPICTSSSLASRLGQKPVR